MIGKGKNEQWVFNGHGISFGALKMVRNCAMV
jgi:hypothetical protein